MRILIGLLAAPLVLGLAQTAGAREGGRPGRRGGEFWRNEQVVEKLDLSPDQVSRLEETGTGFAARERELAERWKASREEMQKAMGEEDFSLEEVSRLGDALAGLAAERSRLKTARVIAVRQILNAEQWSELETGRRRMAERMGRRMRGGNRGGMPKRGGPAEPEDME